MELPHDDLFKLVLEQQYVRLREALARGLTPMLQRDALTPLHMAAASDDLEAASILFEAGAFIDVEAWPESSGLAAIRRMHLAREKPLLRSQMAQASGAMALESDLWDELDRRTRRRFHGEYGLGALGCTPLHIASDRGCAPMVRWLLDCGANAHLPLYLDGGPEGFWAWSPLALAVGQPHEPPHQQAVSLLDQWTQDHPKTSADDAVIAFRDRRVPD